MSYKILSLEPGLDLDFNKLYADTAINKCHELEKFVEKYQRGYTVCIAIALYICEKNKLYRQINNENNLDDQQMKNRYFEEHLPHLCSLNKRTISEYRIAGQFLYEHWDKIERHYNIKQDGLLKKAYLASVANKNGLKTEEIISNMFTLTKEQFKKYVYGEEIPARDVSAQPKSKFEGFVKAYERQRTFFGF
jgi:hypothetical protein